MTIYTDKISNFLNSLIQGNDVSNKRELEKKILYEVDHNFTFQLSIAFYIEFYGLHASNLTNAISRLIRQNNSNINKESLIKFILEKTDLILLVEYHSKFIFKEKKSNYLVLELISFLYTIIIENPESFKTMDMLNRYLKFIYDDNTTRSTTNYEYDLDIRNLIDHPFLLILSKYLSFNGKFISPQKNQIYWGTALIYCTLSKKNINETLILLSTYLEILIQPLIAFESKSEQCNKGRCLSSSFDSVAQLDALNTVLSHMKNLSFNIQLIHEANSDRLHLGQNYLDEKTINLLIEKRCLQENSLFTTPQAHKRLSSEMSTFSNKLNF